MEIKLKQRFIAPFKCGKVAGKQVKDGGYDRNKVISYIEQSKLFILKQIQLYDANIITATFVTSEG